MKGALTWRKLALLALSMAAWSCGDPLADVNYTGPDARSPSTVVKGSVQVSLSTSCGTSLVNDCKGTLLVALADKPLPPPTSKVFGSTTIPGADLSGGAAVTYEILGAPEGSYYLAALLSERSSISDPPYPSAGDLAVEPVLISVKTGVVTVRDLVLNVRWD